MAAANAGDATDAVGSMLRMAGELLFAAARLLSKGEHYAGCALLRQVTEIEYLTWAIKEKHRSAVDWLKSTHAERMKISCARSTEEDLQGPIS